MVSTIPISFGPSAIATRRSTCSPNRSKTSASRGPRSAWTGESSCRSTTTTSPTSGTTRSGPTQRLARTATPRCRDILPVTRALHRQGHPQDARRLLAHDADDAGLPLFRQPQRPWLVELRRREDVEELGQHSRPAGVREALRHRRVALFRAARDRLRPRLRLQRRALSSATTPTSPTTSATSRAGCCGWRKATAAAR